MSLTHMNRFMCTDMNTKKLVTKLTLKYPGKKIIVGNDNEFAEIIVEIEPTKDHPEKSLALAIVGRSKPHYHKISTEIYEVLKGELTLHVDGKEYVLKPGEKMTILPAQVHSAEGEEAWFLTHSTPGWTIEDHIRI